jgi:hypothetical protein
LRGLEPCIIAAERAKTTRTRKLVPPEDVTGIDTETAPGGGRRAVDDPRQARPRRESAWREG